MIVLSTHGLTVRAYSRVLLFDVDMAIPASGVTCLMGPCAAGKSTLLRAVSWQLQGRGGFRVDGVVRYGDHQVSDGYAPAVVAQQLQQPDAVEDTGCARNADDKALCFHAPSPSAEPWPGPARAVRRLIRKPDCGACNGGVTYPRRIGRRFVNQGGWIWQQPIAGSTP